MMHSSKFKSLAISCLPLLLVLAPGCIVSESTYVEFAISTDLTGEVVVEVTGVHSDLDSLADQKEELHEYYEDGYLEEGQTLASALAITDPQISLANKTETSCDLIIEGVYGNIARALSALAGEGDFEIRKSGEVFVARFLMRDSDDVVNADEDEDEDEEFTVAVQYEGQVTDHNAHEVDHDTGTMVWFASQMDESGVQFILSVPSEE